ncbi:nuclear mitotic apparatus protein 1-like [Synchiropus splendidus]|uniref:nuclear mitotic apparatus protein 1-like n=1 Tax=Synchiropus splendidus TaxID=270530 RepID=UPI00237DC80B|nr:nuclear mitotic apparatus protein 1-like [Synchiropus splendidus]
MATCAGVKALLSWVNSLKLVDRDVNADDLQSGSVLLQIVHIIKKTPSPHIGLSVEERFNLISDFLERECRLKQFTGTSLSWDKIRDGRNLIMEISKVLLLLVYHDMMNNRCCLKSLDFEVEQEIARLTSSFVMEAEGCVYLSSELDAYLSQSSLGADVVILDEIDTPSLSSVSTLSSLSEESPMFTRARKIDFVDLHTVASSSTSKSPLQDIMNTPKFQLRKMKREMIKERDLRDSLERELNSNIALIKQRESFINHLQYHLDKLKEKHSDLEKLRSEQIEEMEIKTSALQLRLNDMSLENKDFRNTTSLMERKVDQLTDENGSLSFQLRTVCSQLAAFEAEIGRLTAAQESAQGEWETKINHLQSELERTTSEKEILSEQIQILQGKISHLEDEVSRASKEEVGESMWTVAEKIMENEISSLREELENTMDSLKKAEMEVEAKTLQLTGRELEICKLQQEIDEERASLHQELQHLKVKVEEVEQRRNEQTSKLQEQMEACEREVEILKQIKTEKEQQLSLADAKVKDVEAKLSAAISDLNYKEQQINTLKEEVEVYTVQTRKLMDESQIKEQIIAELRLEKSTELEILQCNMKTVTTQVEDLSLELIQAQQEIQCKQELLAQIQQENVIQRRELELQISLSKEETQKLHLEILTKTEQLATLESCSAQQSEMLQGEIQILNSQIQSLESDLGMAKERIQAQEVLLREQEQQGAHDMHLLQQKLSASEEEMRCIKKEMKAKEENISHLKLQSTEQTRSIRRLEEQVQCLSSSLRTSQENLQSKESEFAKQQVESGQNMETFRKQMTSYHDRVKKLNDEISSKEKHLNVLKEENATQSEALQQEVSYLSHEMKTQRESLLTAKEEIEAKEAVMILLKEQLEHLSQAFKSTEHQLKMKDNLLSEKELDISLEKQKFHNLVKTSQDEVKRLQDNIRSKEEALHRMEAAGTTQSNMLEVLQENVQEKELLQSQVSMYQKEIQKLKESQMLLLEKQELLQTVLSAEQTLGVENEKKLVNLSEDFAIKTNMYEKLKAEVELLEKIKASDDQQRNELQNQLLELTGQVESLSTKLLSKERQLVLSQKDSAEQKKKLDSMNLEMNRYKEAQSLQSIREEAERELKEATTKEKEILVKEKELLVSQLARMEKEQDTRKEEVEALLFERDNLVKTNQTMEMANMASRKMKTALQQELELLKKENQQLVEERNEWKKQVKKEMQQMFTTKKAAEKECMRSNSSSWMLTERIVNCDNLVLSPLEDSLNSTTKMAAPEESSTPLVRSSERLAAKRRGIEAESLESLYFTPIKGKHVGRTNLDSQMDSICKNPTSSVKRRRTTQVINITMTKKTPGKGEEDETFYSLASACSQHNLCSSQTARGECLDDLNTPSKMSGAASDQLIGLPGYRRSAIHAKSSSTFCVGEEPETGPEDWMRIAELQARNKACLPHLKSSYPIEFETRGPSAFVFTDDDVRTGDPSETLHRASMMPGQLQDSLASHRHSLMVRKTNTTGTRSHRLSVMPGQPMPTTISASSVKSPRLTKRSAATLPLSKPSPQKREKASRFPRLLTPRNRNVKTGGPAAAMSPADRRKSMMFTIDNTPKTNKLLKRSLNKLRSSRKGQENTLPAR